ncbi:DNA polymerase III subunit delta [Sphingomonas morindae]|uniref:DNA-directed DNA polymerase n=1 Tax=Sphingomonas morindae TaxID=1541170 RepID=A0ABY4XBG0_9SPHN|nr:DNA polymerase III subunit delta [Sphingomonas morindae]USI74292.1 DNA polymerase III subunit delta [Sphingomonas morindae]
MERALAAPDPAVRCYLLYGPDESGSRALGAALATALGSEAERIDVTGAQLKADPALLADEAASNSLFGGRRFIRVEAAGEESVAAVEALLEAPAAGNPVLLIAGALKKDARLVKLLDAARNALVFASYAPEEADLARLAVALAREAGLAIDADLARRMVDACASDRAILASEILKLALYLDAAPDRPREAGHADLDAIGVDAGEADTSRLLDALFAGEARLLDRELSRAAAEGQDGIPLVRAALRRLLPMAQARAEMEAGAAPKAAVEKAARFLHWRDKDALALALPRWSPPRIAAAIERFAALERTLKSSRGPGPVAADQLLFTIARGMRRR